jgi:carboxymethylenebutenolidase
VSVPAGAGPWLGVVVLHDAAGMTSDLVAQTRWLAEAGFLAAAPDLLGGGTIARCLREIVRDYTAWQGTTFERIEAVRRYLAEREDCTGRVGVIGFCMGGGFALALAPGHGFAAASANYGALPRDAERFFVGACPIIGSYGRRDRSLRHAAERLHEALEAAGVDHEVREYPQARARLHERPCPWRGPGHLPAPRCQRPHSVPRAERRRRPRPHHGLLLPPPHRTDLRADG